MSNLTDLTLSEMRAGLDARKFSSRELVQAALDQIAKLNSSLHAFLHLDAESALKQADEADNNRQLDKPLQGIPIAIKDVLMIEGLPCTCGSKNSRRLYRALYRYLCEAFEGSWSDHHRQNQHG